ncbi:MAG: hypothetical protein ACO1PB_04740 [Ramlibacter sp.]
MSGPFLVMPFASSVQSSEFPGEPDLDDAQILWDPPEDMEPDVPGDAAHSDDAGLEGHPTRTTFLRSRLDEARRVFEREAAAAAATSPAPQTAQWKFIIKQFAPTMRALGSKALVLPAEARLKRDARESANKPPLDRGGDQPAQGDGFPCEARLGERDARGDANKPEFDRQPARAWANHPSAAPLAGPGAKLFAERLRHAATLGASDRACACDCSERLGRRSKQELLREIAWTGASDLPPALLRDGYTKLGLIAILCAAQCQDRAASGGSSKRSTGRGARHAPPRRDPLRGTRLD